LGKLGAIVIGGGFYGMYLAESLAARHGPVVLMESGPGFMGRASFANQARVHQGYHYPRSLLTAVRSRVNFARFVREFAPAIDSDFESIYAVARRQSKVTSAQFATTMRRIGAPIEPAPADVARLFDPEYVEASFLTQEFAFDAAVLRELMAERLHRAGVEARLGTTVEAVRAARSGGVEVAWRTAEGEGRSVAENVFCCAYAQLNVPGAGAGLPLAPLKHELAELALTEPPPELAGKAVTVMDGPFFSLMPFPARGLHTLSHVRYTPHGYWTDSTEAPFRPAYALADAAEKRSAFERMRHDAARFLPCMSGCRYRESLWQVKTVLPRSETDDSRPILYRRDHGIAGYHLIMGGKIDNVYDVTNEVQDHFGRA
jgi:glycine/D-amino acid oxidase-like deaminating enzyme